MGEPPSNPKLSTEARNRKLWCEAVRTALCWPVACLILAGVLWAVTLSEIREDTEEAKQAAMTQAAGFTRAYAEQLSRAATQLEQTALVVKYSWEQSGGAWRLEDQAKKGIYPKSAQIFVTVFGADGLPVSSTQPFRTSTRVTDRPWFVAHRDSPEDRLRISQPERSLRGDRTLIRFTRRINDRNGRFDGVVSVAVQPKYMAAFYYDPALGRGDFVSVRATDGTLVATKLRGSTDSLQPMFKVPPQFEEQAGVIEMSNKEFRDDSARIVSWRKLPDYPFVALIGISETEALASTNITAERYRRYTTVACVFLAVLAFSGMFLSLRLARRKEEADEIRTTYHLAIDGAREGFYMLRALSNAAGEVVDFKCEDCNERGAQLLGMTKASLVGQKLSGLFHGEVLAEKMRLLLEAMEKGYYEDEVNPGTGTLLTVKWVQRRLVSTGSSIALTLRDISDTRAHAEELEVQAKTDVLTGLPNRLWLSKALPGKLEQVAQDGRKLALMFLDLDDFKNVNDTQGHAVGDALLQATAQRLQQAVRPHDTVVRLGGDEFTIVLDQAGDVSEVADVARSVVAAMEQPLQVSGHGSFTVHSSVGISVFPEDGRNGESLLKHADIAMYAAKANGKGQFQFYHPHMSRRLMRRLNTERALRRAIENDEFVVYYQPRVHALTGKLSSMEALIRWEHPNGLRQPMEFIQVAEDTGLILPIGDIVIQKVFAQIAVWKALGRQLVPVSVNVAACQFGQGKVREHILHCSQKSGVAATWVEVEITESGMLSNGTQVSQELSAIRDMGVKLLIDDFGTGYSCLAQLQRLDVDVLKVDRAFTSELKANTEGEALFRAIINMARELEICVVAEGVETQQQLRLLQKLGCDEIQGYYVSRPVPADAISALMTQACLYPAHAGDAIVTSIGKKKSP